MGNLLNTATAEELQGLLWEAAQIMLPIMPALALTRGGEARFFTTAATYRADPERTLSSSTAVLAAADLALGRPTGGWYIEGPWVLGEDSLWVIAARSADGSSEEHVHRMLRLVGLWTRGVIRTRAGSEEMATELEDLQAISRIASITTSGLQLEDVLQTIIETVGAIIGADSGGCLLYEEESDELVLKNPAFGYSDVEDIGIYRVPASGESNAARVFRTGQPYMSNAAGRDPRLLRRVLQAYPAGSIISVPLQVGQKRVGVFHVNRRRENAFTPRHLRLLRMVAPQLAVSIRNAQLFKLLNDQHGTLSRAQQISGGLTRTVLSGAPMEQIAQNLAELINNTVLIFGPQRQALIVAVPEAGEQSPGIDLISRVQPLLEAQAAEPVEHRIDGLEPGGVDLGVLTVPVASGRNLWGYLAVVGTHSWGNSDRLAVQQAALVFALEFLRQQNVAEVERKLKGDFVLELLEGSGTATKETVRRAAQLGCDLSKPHRVLSVAPDPEDEVGTETSPETDLSLSHLVYRLAADHFPQGCLVGTQRGRVIILATDGPGKGHESPVKQFAVTLQERLAKSLGRKISVGIGRTVMARDLPISADDASHCLQAIWAFGRRGTILDYEDLGIAGLLLRTADKAELVRFCQQTLGPLLREANYQQELLNTLWHFCQCSDRQIVAQRTHIHLNTVKYRLQRIQALTRLNLSEPFDLQRLQIAIQIFQLLGAGLS